ncbi:methyl-accepting chemotaxis protein [Thaumasiovibrio subtropicus]|uniref:methyl-accepting chemotaxis protein n=1 Tax=Thaumasiovibrio subtropicus TaxID=1891207 RepID=UPI000B34C5C6|nr:methyl-accepting chemotaxis protein [Thaumasiovibrio subtropicus]
MKFVNKVIATSVVILVGALVGLSLWQYVQVKYEVESLVTQSVDEVLEGVKNTVDEELAVKFDLAAFTAELAEDNLTNEFVDSIIHKSKIRSNFLNAGIGYDADGRFQVNDAAWSTPQGWDPRQRPWYKEAEQAGKLVVTNPYKSASGSEMLVSLAMPVNQANQFAGVMFFDVSLKEMAETINRVTLFDAGYLFLVDSSGVIISHPDANYNGRSIKDVVGDLPYSETLSPFSYKGKEHLIQFTTLASQDWHVGVVLDEEKVFSSLADLRLNAILLTSGASVLAIVILFFVLKKLMSPLSALNLAMKDAASGHGDLTQRLSTDTDLEFADLAGNFNQFTETLQRLIGEMMAIADGIRNDTSSTSTGIQQAAAAMGRQLEEVEMLATAMNEMASSSMEVAANAQNAAAAAQQADVASCRGAEIVDATTEAIRTLSSQIHSSEQAVISLQEASANIESILTVINGIAEQTNLLALNAAIEAARAGESGRGFAVVADEVRNLAQRTQDSTTEISTMISQLMQGTESATLSMQESRELAESSVEQAQHANHALDEIKQAIAAISDMNLQIAAAAEEQSHVAEEINTNTVNIKDISHEVTQSADTLALNIENQVERVNQQEKLLSQFTV